MSSFEAAPVTFSMGSVDYVTEAMVYQRELWDHIEALLGGTKGLRNAGRKYLPQEAKETDSSYIARLRRSFAGGFYLNAVERMIARPFSKPVTFTFPDGFELSPELEQMVQNTDRQGSSLTQFARQLYRDGAHYGIAHFLVDYPSVPDGATAEDRQRIEAAPFFRRICPTNVIGFRETDAREDAQHIGQVRVEGGYVSPVGEFGEEYVSTIDVLSKGGSQRWEKQGGGEAATGFEFVDERPWLGANGDPLGYLPMITVYFERVDLMIGRPVFNELGWKDILYWQSSSDQNNILKYARLPTRTAVGLNTEDLKRINDIGPNSFLKTSNPDAKFGFLEHGGQAIQSGADQLESLKQDMERMGTAPYQRNSGGQTATGVAADDAGLMTASQMYVRAIEDGLTKGFVIASEGYLGEDWPDNARVNLYSEDRIGNSTEIGIRNLDSMRSRGDLALEDFLTELVSRGEFGEGFDPAEAARRAQEEQGEMIGAIPEAIPADADPNVEEGQDV